MYGDNPLPAFIGRQVTYVLTSEQLREYGVKTVAASINWIHSESSADLTVTLGGQTLNLTSVSQGDATTQAPGSWY